MPRTRAHACLRKSSKAITPVKGEGSQQPIQCVICLDNISSRGKLPTCHHHFCFTCIHEWSKKTNRCPLCKQKFRAISKISLSDASPVRLVRVPDKELAEDEENISYFGLESWELSQMVANEYDLEDSFIDNDDPSFAWLEESSTSSDSSSDEEWETEGSLFHCCPTYNLRTRPSPPLLLDQDNSGSQSTLVQGSCESDLEKTDEAVANAENLACSFVDGSEQDEHFRAVRRSGRKKDRPWCQLCDDDEEVEEESEADEVVHRRHKRKVVKPLSSSSESEVGSDVLAGDKGFRLSTSPYLAGNFLQTSSPMPDGSCCCLERDNRSVLASKENGESGKRTLKESSRRHLACDLSGHRPSHTTSSFNQHKRMHLLSPTVRKRKGRMRQENLFHFFSSPLRPESTDVIDPLVLPPSPSSPRRGSTAATAKSLPLVSKSRQLRDFDSTSDRFSSGDVRWNKSTRKLKPLQPNCHHNHQDDFKGEGEVSVSSGDWLSARKMRRMALEITRHGRTRKRRSRHTTKYNSVNVTNNGFSSDTTD